MKEWVKNVYRAHLEPSTIKWVQDQVAGPVQKDRPLTKLEAANAVCIKQLTKVDNI